MTTEISAAKQEWDRLPVVARVALCKALDLEGIHGSASWERLPDKVQKKLEFELLAEDLRELARKESHPFVTEVQPQDSPSLQKGSKKRPDTDPSDRTVKAGWSSGKPVYRASMAGRCLRELFLWRIGAGELLPQRDESYETEDAGILAAREGIRHEPWIVEDLKQQGYEVAWSGTGDKQLELERRYKRYVVRSHPDGKTRGKELGEEWHVLECKAMKEDRFLQFKQIGWAAFKGYAHQLSIEMDLSGNKGFFVVKNRNTGKTEKYRIEEPPIDPKTIYAKFSQIENMIEAAEAGEAPLAPECGPDAEWYWCPFFNLGKCSILEGREAEEVDEVEDEEFEEILTQFKASKKEIKKHEEIVEGLRSAIISRVSGFQQRLKVGGFFAAYSERTRRGFSIPRAKNWIKEQGGSPEDFDTETSYMELRVTGGKETEKEDER